MAAVLIVNSARTKQAETATSTAQITPAANESRPCDRRHPAYSMCRLTFTSAPSRNSLAPTLDPEVFTGITRDAYRAVKQIPTTIAQLPCYCHCDEGMGHKSLYSCFEDDHASHCAVCVNEALLALRLEREQKLTPAQIRERIVEQYSQQ